MDYLQCKPSQNNAHFLLAPLFIDLRDPTVSLYTQLKAAKSEEDVKEILQNLPLCLVGVSKPWHRLTA